MLQYKGCWCTFWCTLKMSRKAKRKFRRHKAKDSDLATRLADHDYVVFVPNYGLAPAHPFPGGRQDVLDAIVWQ